MYGHVIKRNKAQSRSIIQNLENRFANQGSDISPLLGYGETVMPTAADIVAQRWAVWGNVSTSILDGEIGADISGHQLRQHFGFDYALNNNVIVGLSFDLNPNASDAMSAKGDRVTVSASLELAHTLISEPDLAKPICVPALSMLIQMAMIPAQLFPPTITAKVFQGLLRPVFNTTWSMASTSVLK